MSTTKDNAQTFQQMYKHGFGLKYPSDFMISIHHNYLKNREYPENGGMIFDYGCGIGTTLSYFNSLPDEKWNCYGVDTSEEACEVANSRLGTQNVFLIAPEEQPSLAGLCVKKYGNVLFDAILSVSVFHFLQDSEIKVLLEQFSKMLHKDGIVVFTIQDVNNWRYNSSSPCENSDLRSYSLQNATSSNDEFTGYGNFKTALEFEELCSPYFAKIFLGYYDVCTKEIHVGGTKRHIFIGKKL